MNESIIDGLFYGGITAFGRRVVPSPQSLQINRKIDQERSFLVESMSADNLEHLEALENLRSQADMLEERDVFGYGLRLGVALMCEVFLAEHSLPIEAK